MGVIVGKNSDIVFKGFVVRFFGASREANRALDIGKFWFDCQHGNFSCANFQEAGWRDTALSQRLHGVG